MSVGIRVIPAVGLAVSVPSANLAVHDSGSRRSSCESSRSRHSGGPCGAIPCALGACLLSVDHGVGFGRVVLCRRTGSRGADCAARRPAGAQGGQRLRLHRQAIRQLLSQSRHRSGALSGAPAAMQRLLRSRRKARQAQGAGGGRPARSRGLSLRGGLQVATTFVGEMPRVPEALRTDFQQALAEQLRRVAAERGVALGPGLGNAIHRSLGRVAAERALIQCHILSTQGRECLHRLSPSVA